LATLLPSAFERRPYIGVKLEVARRKLVPSHEAWFARWNCDEIEETSVATMVPAMRKSVNLVHAVLMYKIV